MLALGMFDWVPQLTGGDLRFALLLTTGTLVVIVWISAAAWRRVKQTDQRTRLAALLVQRGLPTAEVERILKLAIGDGASDDSDEAVDPALDPETQLVQILAGNSYDGSDISTIVTAARSAGPITPAIVARVKAMSAQWQEASEIATYLMSHQPGGPALRVKADSA